MARSLIVALCVLFIGLPQLLSSFHDSQRYATATESDWEGTNNSLESATCARKTGKWLLQLCDGDRIVPFSAEDPGQALLMSAWARLAGRDATVMDVARLNLGINALGLVVLVATLITFGTFATAVVVLILGPTVFLSWFDTLPHWALIGTVSMQLILPLALIARARSWLSPTVSGLLIAVGLLLLAFASLLREVVGLSVLLVTIVAGIWALWHDRHRRRRWMATIAILAAAVVASQSSRLVITARNAAYALDAANLPATHGMSHTLYIGLGAVPNKWGIRYDDAVGREAAAAAEPGVAMYSKDYFRVMSALYWAKWREDPGEVARIYLVKLGILLGDSVIELTPPLGVLLVLVTAIQLLARHRRWTAGDRGGETRLAINLIVLGLIGLIMAQAMLATPTRLYTMPIGPLILVLVGIAVENLASWAWRTIARPTTQSP
ncbi:MAG: hypothetical protein J0J01_11825 [Reyranella sp.]|uniref:hypothetical protein n=1 Tax=Reyranella sp. TaxID=1929291 RepID=UPI001ACCB248|nr:hypothetical protein [Reyranella sp.]MBN9087589.1 hypothetical protein [Reyranella sp.]